ncbi:dual serine/threonine and tyrosine protein kinase-like [Glandiceps talaboti]
MAETNKPVDSPVNTLINNFDKFNDWKKTIKGAYDETKSCFDDLVKVCAPQTQPKLKKAFLNEKDRSLLELFIQKQNVPKILVIGHNNSGKTSFINELLGYRALPTSDISTASRTVKLQHSETQYAQIVDSKSKKIRYCELSPSQTVPNDFIVLPEEDGKVKHTERTSVEVGLDHQLLKSGLVLCDVPSFDKSNILDLVNHESVQGVLPLVMYVIDGNYGVRLWDQDMLCSLYKLSPQLKIFYICSKVDIDRVAEEMDQPSEDEEEDDEDDITFSTDKMKRTYKALVAFGFFNDKEDMHSNTYFHGVSVREVATSRENGSKSGRYADDFDRIKRDYNQLAMELLKRRSYRVVLPLYNAQARCCKALLVPSLQTRDVVESKSTQNLELLKYHVQAARRLVDSYTVDIEAAISAAIAVSMPQIITTAREMQFSPIEVRTFVHKDEMMRQLEDQVRNMVTMKLTQKIKEKLTEAINIDNLVAEISQTLNIVEPTGLQHISIQPQFDGIQDKIRWQINNHIVSNRLKNILKKASHLLSGTTVDAKWREDIAKEALHRIKPSDIREIVCNELYQKIDEFQEDVKTFIQCVDDLAVISTVGCDATRSTPPKLRSLCLHHFRTDALIHSIQNRVVKLNKTNDLFDEGERTRVFYQTKWPLSEGPVGLRIGKRTQNMSKDVAVLLAIGRFDGSPPSASVLPVLAMADVELDRNKCVATVVPRMDGDLWSELQSGGLAESFTIKERLQIACDIATTCKTLSATGFPVQDLRVTNILIKKSTQLRQWKGVINTLKPRDDKISYPDHKPPFHIAPEDYRDDNKGYRNDNDSSNVYAFGVLLWLLIAGKFIRPSYAESIEKLRVAVVNEHRVPDTTESLCNTLADRKEKQIIIPLIDSCLSYEKSQRPTWDKICADIAQCINIPIHPQSSSPLPLKVTRV